MDFKTAENHSKQNQICFKALRKVYRFFIYLCPNHFILNSVNLSVLL